MRRSPAHMWGVCTEFLLPELLSILALEQDDTGWLTLRVRMTFQVMQVAGAMRDLMDTLP